MDTLPLELIDHLVSESTLERDRIERLAYEVLEFWGETVEDFVRRRHSELAREGYSNVSIWPMLVTEVGQRRFRSPQINERQVRRLIYG